MKFRALFLFCALFLVGQNSPAMEKAVQANEHLKPLLPFVGKTWKGVFANSTADKPMVDVARWELALNGQAIRVLHSVNDGIYGGESIIMWDAKQSKLMSFYFTTAGFFTTSAIEAGGDSFKSHEMVTGNQNGITEVLSTTQILPDGRMHSKSKYLQNGAWVDGHEIMYSEDANAQVVLP